MIFHYHILTWNANDTIQNIYFKQIKTHCKGDLYITLLKDFNFIEEEKNDEEIVTIKKAFIRKENKLENLGKLE